MELKYLAKSERDKPVSCFNRTFMELKLECSILLVSCSHRFNRTFMELKWL